MHVSGIVVRSEAIDLGIPSSPKPADKERHGGHSSIHSIYASATIRIYFAPRRDLFFVVSHTYMTVACQAVSERASSIKVQNQRKLL